jgi:hypothetical protein
MEIKDIIFLLINERSAEDCYSENNQPTYSFFVIMLNSISSLINNFIAIKRSEISNQNFDLMRRVIGSFEQLKNNFTKSAEANALSLSLSEKGFLHKFFTSIDFMLRRFGKIISMFSVIQ